MDLRTIDDGCWAWIKATAARNFWRVSPWYDLDDLIQDGVEQYYVVLNKYPNVENRKHLMALFKLRFTHHIHNLARYRTVRRREEPRIAEMAAEAGYATEGDLLDTLLGGDTSIDSFIMESDHVEALHLIQLLESEEGTDRITRPSRKWLHGKRETTNERLCRLVGADPEQRYKLGSNWVDLATLFRVVIKGCYTVAS